MNFGNVGGLVGGYAEPQARMEQMKNAIGTLAKPRTLREQLQDQIAYHTAKIADLNEAVDALTPDVEKALNALQKL